MTASRESAAEALRDIAKQIESGELDTYGPVIWDHKHGLKLLGATGEFPEGKLDEHDQGELCVAVETKDGSIVIHFGKSVFWLGLGPDEAESLGSVLIERAKQIREAAEPAPKLVVPDACLEEGMLTQNICLRELENGTVWTTPHLGGCMGLPARDVIRDRNLGSEAPVPARYGAGYHCFNSKCSYTGG